MSLPRLYHGSTRAVDDVLAGGALGRLTYGRVRLSHDGAVAGWLPERFFDPSEAIGGALTDLGCHPVYLIQRFLGPDPDTVTATYRSLRVSGPEGWTELPVPADGEDAFAQWAGHIRAGTRAADNLARAAELTRLVVAANEAAATGRTRTYP